MGHGIGPQNLGAQGMSSKSKPCGSPLDASEAQNAAFGPGSELANKDPQRAAKILDGINAEDSGANYGTPLDMVAPEIMGSLVKGAAGAFAANTGSTPGASIRKRQLANVRNIAAAGPGPASPGGGSGGIQSDLEGLQTKLADLKSQIDNLANTV